ncbi:uncharacterized protein [Aristolochia californica]|uniref:uncharacterized protein n=1 Tax=Aristolochia californica TaxID=171875 RepID=UPI0035DE070B
MSPFEIVYGQNPSGVFELAPIPRVGRLSHKANEMAKHFRGIHEQVKLAIHESNAKYKVKADSHRRQRINDNACRLRLPSHLRTSDVFNVKHLSPCFVDSAEAIVNSRTGSFQPEATDAGGSKSDDAELSDSTLLALRYLELADQCKDGRTAHMTPIWKGLFGAHVVVTKLCSEVILNPIWARFLEDYFFN